MVSIVMIILMFTPNQVKKLLERMPRANHAVLKFIFQHFVR